MADAAKRRSYDPYRNISYAYDGSAARVLEHDEVLRPEPRQHTRRQAIARPRVRVREAGQVSLFAVCGFAAVAVMAVLILMCYVQLSSISSDMVALDSELTRLKSEEAALMARYELAYDLNTIESTVTADGSMIRPQPGQLIYVDLTEPDSVVVYDNGTETEKSFLDGIREIVGNVLAYF